MTLSSWTDAVYWSGKNPNEVEETIVMSQKGLTKFRPLRIRVFICLS